MWWDIGCLASSTWEETFGKVRGTLPLCFPLLPLSSPLFWTAVPTVLHAAGIESVRSWEAWLKEALLYNIPLYRRAVF